MRGKILATCMGLGSGIFVGWVGKTAVHEHEIKYNERKMLNSENEESHKENKRSGMAYGPPVSSLGVQEYQGHILVYDTEKKIPKWVAEKLNNKSLQGDANRRHAKFRPDPAIPEIFQSHNSDYVHSGWSRGHMAPAGDCKQSQKTMNDTFYLSNVLPQNLDNNAGFWNRLEMYVRDLTDEYDNIHVLSGPVMIPYKEDDGKSYVKYQVIGMSRVAVPTHMFKVIVAEKNGHDPHLGVFLVLNEAIPWSHTPQQYEIPLADLESYSGIMIHPKLDRKKTKNLCVENGCKLISYDIFQLWIATKSIDRADTLEKLEKVKLKLEKKNIVPDEQFLAAYSAKKKVLTGEE